MPKVLLLLMALITAVTVPTACGDSGDSYAGNTADASFVADMIPHHEGAVMMAMMAKQRAERPGLDAMADEIITAQQQEIVQMRDLQDDLPEVESDRDDSMMMGEEHMGHTGMDAEAMGMDMDLMELKVAGSFDLAFIEMMIPHHEGAVEMAEQLLEKGENAELQQLARAVVSSQNAEVETMRNWRRQWSDDASDATAGDGR